MSRQNRSKVCPKALTLSQLKNVKIGGEVALFYTGTGYWSRPEYEIFTYHGIKTEKGRTKALLKNVDGVLSESPAEELGLAPYKRGTDRCELDGAVNTHGWSEITCMVKKEDISSLPMRRRR